VDQISRIGMDTSKHISQLHGVNASEVPVLRKGPPRNWGSSGNRGWRGYVVRWVKLLSEVETEVAIVDGATNLKQEVRAAS
jgi:hypothetical protein